MINEDIKQAMIRAKVRFWQVADRLNITDGNFSRKLRKELSPQEKIKIMEFIKDLSKEKEVK